MDNKLKKDLLSTLNFLKKVYEQASTDRNASQKGRDKSNKELRKLEELIKNIKNEE